MSAGRCSQPERGHAGRHRARADDHDTSWPPAADVGHLLAQLGDHGLVDRAQLVGERRRADLDDDPGHGSDVRLVLEAEVADPDDVAVAGAGPGQQPGHAEPLRAGGRCRRQRLGCGDVVEGDDPLDLAADDAELVLADPLDADALRPRGG